MVRVAHGQISGMRASRCPFVEGREGSEMNASAPERKRVTLKDELKSGQMFWEAHSGIEPGSGLLEANAAKICDILTVVKKFLTAFVG